MAWSTKGSTSPSQSAVWYHCFAADASSLACGCGSKDRLRLGFCITLFSYSSQRNMPFNPGTQPAWYCKCFSLYCWPISFCITLVRSNYCPWQRQWWASYKAKHLEASKAFLVSLSISLCSYIPVTTSCSGFMGCDSVSRFSSRVWQLQSKDSSMNEALLDTHEYSEDQAGRPEESS